LPLVWPLDALRHHLQIKIKGQAQDRLHERLTAGIFNHGGCKAAVNLHAIDW
jgi:hypothetical protein